MALIPATLQSGLQPLNAPVASGSITAMTIMNAFQAYALGAANMMQGPALAMPGWPGALSSLQASMSAPVPAPSIFVMNLTMAIHTAWSSLQTLYQVAPLVAVPTTLQSALEPICAVPGQPTSVWIAGFTSAVHTYCLSSTCTGIFPAVPTPIPFSGPVL